MTRDVEQVVAAIERAASEFDGGPFPYDECRHALKLAGTILPGLVPSLDLYFYDTFAHGTEVRRVTTWPLDKIMVARQQFATSFFDRHPEYRSLETVIADDTTPQLKIRLDVTNEIRGLLLELFDQLQRRGEDDQ